VLETLVFREPRPLWFRPVELADPKAPLGQKSCSTAGRGDPSGHRRWSRDREGRVFHLARVPGNRIVLLVTYRRYYCV